MRTRSRSPLLLLLLLAILSAPTSAAAQLRRTADERQRLHFGGVERHYVVRVPERTARRDTGAPLVLVLHGGGGNASNAERMTGFTRLAESEGFFVAYPEGTSRGRSRLLTWNAGHCCGSAMKGDVDDVGFIAALIDTLQRRHRIDATRIYVTGMSNGAMMAHRLGIELSHRIAAIAPVAGTIFGDEQKPRGAVAALMINGMLDRSVPFEGGTPGGSGAGAWDGVPASPAMAQADFWASANRCRTPPRREEGERYALVTYDCPSSRRVALYAVKDNGHAWPGGSRGRRRANAPSDAIDATRVIWDFFAQHRRD